nr:DNA-directed RNA polymerases II, IV and V subunit 9B [Tanacetum cinerariifolium]
MKSKSIHTHTTNRKQKKFSLTPQSHSRSRLGFSGKVIHGCPSNPVFQVAEPKKKQDVLNSNLQQKQKTDKAATILQDEIFKDVAADPTLPCTKGIRCAECGHEQAVFFQKRLSFCKSS